MGTLAKIMPNLEHLEIIKCIEVAEFGINTLIEKLPKLQFLDVAKIPIINYAFLDELKKLKPDLLIRRN